MGRGLPHATAHHSSSHNDSRVHHHHHRHHYRYDGVEALSEEDISTLQMSNCYLREFLAKPHPLVGRKGPVCPFVPSALKFNSLYLSVIRTPGMTTPKATIEAAARSFITRFGELEPKEGRRAPYKAVVLLFPDVPVHRAPELIDAVQANLKLEFVAKGLMIGEFHKASAALLLPRSRHVIDTTPSPSSTRPTMRQACGTTRSTHSVRVALSGPGRTSGALYLARCL